ncbi:MAG: TlpA family protein disulfide reductase [Candidatus Promineifilaceae bacterium]
MRPLSRSCLRRLGPFLGLGGLAWLLAGCGGAGRASPAEPGATAVTPSAGPSAIQLAVVSDDFAAGRPRVPFVLFAGPQKVADAQRVALTVFDLTPATPTPGWAGEASNYSDYQVPYWVAYPELPHAGYWGLAAEIILADGTTTQAQFAIEVAENSHSPAVGSRPPASRNRTLKTEPDLSKLTSDPTPSPGLYQMTIAETLDSGRPTVVTFATPAFCQTEFCAPVVDSVEQVYETFKDKANFIHVEVYKTFNPLVLADEMSEWGFSSEPWTFVLDSTGQVAARLGGPVSPRELTAALTPLLP